jgi:hypothetical protein
VHGAWGLLELFDFVLQEQLLTLEFCDADIVGARMSHFGFDLPVKCLMPTKKLSEMCVCGHAMTLLQVHRNGSVTQLFGEARDLGAASSEKSTPIVGFIFRS